MNGKTDAPARIGIEIGMRRREGLRFLCGRIAKAVDIVVAVAFAVIEAKQCAQCKILLQGEPRLAGQVFTGDKTFGPVHIARDHPGRVHYRLVEALAGFRGYAAIAEPESRRPSVIGIVRLVDNEVATTESAERRPLGNIARQRLLDILQPARDGCERAVALQSVNQHFKGAQVGVLLVAVERDAVMVRQRRKLAANPDQSRGVRFRVAAELELEVTRARICAWIGNTAFALDLVLKADGMTDRDTPGPVLVGKPKKAADIAFTEIRRQALVDAGDVLGHPVEETGVDAAQQCVEDRLVNLGGAIGRSERRNVLLGAGRHLRADARGMQLERGQETGLRKIQPPRDLKRPSQAIDRLRRRELGPLVEPFWHQQLGTGADRNSPALDLDLGTHEELRCRVKRDRAEAERPRETHGTFEERYISQLQAQRHGP